MTVIKLQCPKCGEFELTRAHRAGFLQLRIYPKLGLYPWECAQCRRISMLKSRTGRSLMAHARVEHRTGPGSIPAHLHADCQPQQPSRPPFTP
uniref:Uncharacterized protein n=1 Tax=Paracidobacterium acidisoli TaxID=2303751 RepID=A0A372IR89_9BACT